MVVCPQSPLLLISPSHPVLDVVVDDEVQFLVCESIVLRYYTVNFVDDGFGKLDFLIAIFILPIYFQLIFYVTSKFFFY